MYIYIFVHLKLSTRYQGEQLMKILFHIKFAGHDITIGHDSNSMLTDNKVLLSVKFKGLTVRKNYIVP